MVDRSRVGLLGDCMARLPHALLCLDVAATKIGMLAGEFYNHFFAYALGNIGTELSSKKLCLRIVTVTPKVIRIDGR